MYRVYVDKRDVGNRENQRIMINEYLVPENGGNDIYFNCLREVGNPGVGCTGSVNYGENLVLEFQFRRSELENWKMFYEASVRLLNDFKRNADN